jgi:hypothetical protein
MQTKAKSKKQKTKAKNEREKWEAKVRSERQSKKTPWAKAKQSKAIVNEKWKLGKS